MKNTDCYHVKSCCKDLNFVDKISLSYCNTIIKDIIDFSVKVFIVENTIINTCNAEKLVLKGYKVITIEYLSNNCTGKVLCKKFAVPFFDLIPIPCCSRIIDVNVDISYCDIKQCSPSTVWFFNIVSICLSIYIKKSKPIIYNNKTHTNCCKNWNFKNDCYPNNKNNYCCDNKNIRCYDNKEIMKEKYFCTKQICKQKP